MELNKMKNLLTDVKAFHEMCAVPVSSSLAFPSSDRIELRKRLIAEEHEEFRKACDSRDMIEVADALADIIYVAVGTALEFGIPLDKVWAEVQRSNMAKADPATGKAKHRADGKVLKPDGWSPPNIHKALEIEL